MKQKGILIFTAVLCAASLWGCSRQPEGIQVTETKIQQLTPKQAGDLTFGWSVYTLDNEFFQRMDKAVREQAAAAGITLLSHDQNSDAREMVKACKSMIAQDVDALLVSPCNPQEMPEIIDAAHERDIPVVIVDIGDGGGDKDAIIISDGYQGGREAAEYAVGLLQEKGFPGKKLGIVNCEDTAVYAAQRGEGFQEAAQAAGYEIAAQEKGDSREDLGYQAAKRMLEKEPDLAAIFAENDVMALGAVKAVKEAGSHALIFGYDGNQLAINAIIEKKMQGTMKQDAEAMGAKGVEIAEKLIDGGKITYDNPQTKEIFVDGYMIGEDSDRVKQ